MAVTSNELHKTPKSFHDSPVTKHHVVFERYISKLKSKNTHLKKGTSTFIIQLTVFEMIYQILTKYNYPNLPRRERP